MLLVGLTGGIASGKSTVARRFLELGADVIDTDELAREVVAPGSDGLRAVIEAFGPEILDEHGELDRRRLRDRVFRDRAARQRLEGILHPLIERLALERAHASRAPYVVLVVPLLVETGWERLVDRVVVVDLPESRQIERVQARDHIGREQAEAIMHAQADRSTRLAAADDIIDNSASQQATLSQVDRLHARYLALTAGN